ncbi:MAG: uracil-DNA glycosylase [Bacillota bacterium]
MKKDEQRRQDMRQMGLDFVAGGEQEEETLTPWASFWKEAGEEQETLESLGVRVSVCRKCSLRSGCRQVVFGEGDPEAELMFVGEAPGADEDRLGRPFVGRAGQLLNRILEACGLSREKVYITNIVKCRPQGNRTPTPDERETCIPYLRTQVRLIRPRIIVTLGAAATQGLIDPRAKITRMRGTWQNWQGIKVMPTFHPAALLRDPGKKAPTWQDMKLVMAELEGDG